MACVPRKLLIMNIINFYKLLEVEWNAEAKQIDEAFERKKLEYNYLDPNSESKIQLDLLKKGYEILSDPDKRSAYDTDYFIQFIKGKVHSIPSNNFNSDPNDFSEISKTTEKPAKSINIKLALIPILFFCLFALGFTTFLNVKTYKKANKVLNKTIEENKLLAAEKSNLKKQTQINKNKISFGKEVQSTIKSLPALGTNIVAEQSENLEMKNSENNTDLDQYTKNELASNLNKSKAKRTTDINEKLMVESKAISTSQIKTDPKPDLSTVETKKEDNIVETKKVSNNKKIIAPSPSSQSISGEAKPTETKNNFTKKNNEIVKPTPTKSFRPESGYQPYNSFYGRTIKDSSSGNKLIVENKSRKDAVVCIINKATNKVYSNVFIRAKENEIVSKIPEGDYYLKSYFGKNWNPNFKPADGNLEGGFTEQESFECYLRKEQILELRKDTVDQKVRFATYKVEFGNPRMQLDHQGIPRNQFFTD